ncbi:MAG: DUF456 domain-containing protein [Chloroflexi bacterium]|jgi:uncharacterized protein|nr:DUF456 domain-containing protein [Chloroflexota bacterium]
MPEWILATSRFLIILTMVVGQLGLVIPIFPGNVVIWAAALVYGILFGFGKPGGILFGVITLLMFVAVTADNVFMGAKAREKGAAWPSIFAALAAAVVFTFMFPPIGGLIAAPLVLYLMEFRRLNDSKQATEIVKGLMLGLGLSFAARFALGLVMIGLWAVWAY